MAEKTIMLVVFSRNEYEFIVTKMEKAAIARGIDAEIFAVSRSRS